MAKQALCEALSLDKPSYLPDATQTSSGYNLYSKPMINQTSSTYASSTENIARLLEGWMRNSKKSKQTNSVMTNSSSSEGALSTTNQEAFDSLFSANSSNSESASMDENGNVITENSLFQDESKPEFETQVPFTLLEEWLFDDCGTNQGQEEDLIDMPLEETAELF